MKPFLPLTFVLSLFASCVSNRYYTIAADNIAKNDSHQLISENDTLRVEYLFSVHSNQMTISIFNKLKEPIEVDWNKSALISNEQAVSFYNPNIQFSGTIDNANRVSLLTGTLADVNGSLVINQPSQFIFPNTSLAKMSRPISAVAKADIDIKGARAEKVEFSGKPYSVHLKKMKFEKDSTPLTFRTYLTFRTGEKEKQQEFKVEQSFYVTEIWQTRFDVYDFPSNVLPRPDRAHF